MTNEAGLSVSELNLIISEAIRRDPRTRSVLVRGEVSSFRNQIASGHWYFSLKDAQASITCAMFRNANLRAQIRPKDGDQVLAEGYIDFYAPQVFTDQKGRQILVGWMGLPDIELQYQVPTYEWLHTLTWLRELSLNEAGKICQWPCEEYNALRGERVDFTPEGAVDSNGKLGTSNYDAFDIEGAIGAKFANGTADVFLEGIEGEGRLMLNGDLELVVIGNMLELAFHGISTSLNK